MHFYQKNFEILNYLLYFIIIYSLIASKNILVHLFLGKPKIPLEIAGIEIDLHFKSLANINLIKITNSKKIILITYF